MNSTASTTSMASMTSTASFYEKTSNVKKNIHLWWFIIFYFVKKAPKSQNNSKKFKEQYILTNWTIDGAQRQKIKIDEFGIKVSFSWTRGIQNISKNLTLYLHQSKITLPGLLWDTLY